MQKKIFTTLVVLITILFIMPSCGKYEEGPAFSIIPKKNRVANIWKIEKVFINDVDRSDIYQEYINSYKLELTKDEKLTVEYTTNIGSISENGTWVFENSAENISFTVSGDKTTFKILRLTSGEMWLEETELGQKYVTHYISY